MRVLTTNECVQVSGAGVWCGPNGSWISNLIPDSPFGFDFGMACLIHDMEYKNPEGQTREQIDQKFKNAMLVEVGNSVIGKVAAEIYYQAVRAFGESQFNNDGTANQNDAAVIREYIVDNVAEDLLPLDALPPDIYADTSDFGQDVIDAWNELGGGGKIGELDPWDDGLVAGPQPAANQQFMHAVA
jgi:hypothetical protein